MPGRILLLVLLGGALTVGNWGCREEGEVEEGAPPMIGAVQQVALPDTTGAAVSEYLETVGYRANWKLWPGKGELYTGQEPHGVLLTTYLNPVAYQALTAEAGSMPTGAIIVKENYTPDSTLAAITIMYKVRGYGYVSEKNEWFWVKRLADGTIDVEGRETGCIACHSTQRENDFIFTGSLRD